MKKILNIAVIMLILAGGSFSCGKEKNKIISPIVPDVRLVEFFNNVLPAPSMTKSNCLFTTTDNDVCYIINSIDEFILIYSCDDLPEIDFTSYSLILGQKKMSSSYYSVIEQYIVETSSLQLNVVVKLPESHWPSFSTLYYWGLYPKFDNKEISVNIVNEKES